MGFSRTPETLILSSPAAKIIEALSVYCRGTSSGRMRYCLGCLDRPKGMQLVALPGAIILVVWMMKTKWNFSPEVILRQLSHYTIAASFVISKVSTDFWSSDLFVPFLKETRIPQPFPAIAEIDSHRVWRWLKWVRAHPGAKNPHFFPFLVFCFVCLSAFPPSQIQWCRKGREWFYRNDEIWPHPHCQPYNSLKKKWETGYR